MHRAVRIVSVAFVGMVVLMGSNFARVERGRPKPDPQGTGSGLARLVCQ